MVLSARAQPSSSSTAIKPTAPAMIGSGVWAGAFDLDFGHSRTDKRGLSIKDELQRIGYLGPETCEPQPPFAAFEVHIEQGPILENEGRQIGVVMGVQGMRWYDLTIEGQACHAGPTPMGMRRDPFMALAKIIDQYYRLIEEHGSWARITFGDIRAEPGSRNTVPERVVVTIDLRHPDQTVLEQIDQTLRRIAAEVCEAKNLQATIRQEWDSPAIAFDDACINAVRAATEMLGYESMEIVSGAGHDSVYVSSVAPTGMIFVPCEHGLSHNEAENASPADLEAGCNVLLHAILDRAPGGARRTRRTAPAGACRALL